MGSVLAIGLFIGLVRVGEELREQGGEESQLVITHDRLE